MPDSILSGYKQAATLVAFTTNLFDAMADNEWTAMSDEVDNSGPKYMSADFEVVLGSVTFVGADSIIELYMSISVDDTNFDDWAGAGGTSDEQENNQLFVGSVTTSGAVGAQRRNIRNVSLPNGKWKVALRNKAGVTLNATNTLKWRPHQFASG
jgi:hypothetical protein